MAFDGHYIYLRPFNLPYIAIAPEGRHIFDRLKKWFPEEF